MNKFLQIYSYSELVSFVKEAMRSAPLRNQLDAWALASYLAYNVRAAKVDEALEILEMLTQRHFLKRVDENYFIIEFVCLPLGSQCFYVLKDYVTY